MQNKANAPPVGGLCSRGGRKLADLKESLFGIIIADHPSLGVLYLYCKQTKVEVDAKVRLLAGMVVCSSLLYCAEELSCS